MSAIRGGRPITVRLVRMLTGLLDRWSEFAVSRNIISTRLPLPAVAIPPWLKHGLLRKDISRKIIYLFLHRCLISRREDFFLIDRGISSIGRKKFTERKIVRRKGEQHVLGIPCVSLRQLQISCDGNPTKSTRAVHACRVRGSHLACA